MSYDISKLVKLGHLKDLATKIKNDYATKAELQAIKLPEYSVAKQATAEAGYLSTYYLTKDGAQVGEKINIPKDFLVNSADILEVETADDPYEGAQVGDLYIDFVINAKGGGDTATHIYLPVNELVDAYTGGNGIEVSAQNLISAKIDTANANGLAVTTPASSWIWRPPAPPAPCLPPIRPRWTGSPPAPPRSRRARPTETSRSTVRRRPSTPIPSTPPRSPAFTR